MQIAQEEIFGPVAAILPYKTIDEAVEIANDSIYGLAARIWTSDLNTAHKAARDIQAGVVWVNCFDHGDMTLPWGGYKQSGIGPRQVLGDDAAHIPRPSRSGSISAADPFQFARDDERRCLRTPPFLFAVLRKGVIGGLFAHSLHKPKSSLPGLARQSTGPRLRVRHDAWTLRPPFRGARARRNPVVPWIAGPSPAMTN